MTQGTRSGDDGAVLRLSRHVMPQVRMGSQLLTPQNMAGGEERLGYLLGLVEHLNRLGRDEGIEMDDIARFLDGTPFGRMLTALEVRGGQLQARLREDAADFVRFDPDRLAVVFADGRRRRAEEMTTIETGAATPELGPLVAALASGLPCSALAVRCAASAIELDEDFVEGLIEREVIERVPEGMTGAAAVDPRFHVGEGDHLTWLGHATALFQSGGTALWIDPHLYPVLRWQPGEAALAFSEYFAESFLFEDYGPACRQLTVHDLPPPEAVLITHQDVDHFNLGVLMTLPEETTIVVPDAAPGRPWDVDLERVIHVLLGAGRKVRRLGHGEALGFGSVQVTALPFLGEFPASLPHAWNCYLIETERSVVAVTADSAVRQEQAALLAERLEAGRRVGLLLGRDIHADGSMDSGWRENRGELLNPIRLWSWYAPVHSWFAPAWPLGMSERSARELVAAGLRFMFPYAAGATPWFRFHDPGHFFRAGVGSMSVGEFRAFERRAAAVGLAIPPLRYGVPLRLDGRR